MTPALSMSRHAARRTRSMFIALGVVGLLAVVLGGSTQALPRAGAAVTTSPPTTPLSSAVALPVRPSPGCDNPSGSPASGVSDVSLVSGGERRSYLRTIPIGDEPAPAPLVVVLDDGSGDPGAFIDRSHWNAVAQSRHLVVVAPRWTRADDAQFAADAIVDAGVTTCVDLARVYLVGFATGAMLGSRVVCDHPALVTAFVAVAGLLTPDGCSPDVRVPVLAVQGALDEVVSASSAVDAAKAWARQDGCQPEPFSETVGWNIEHFEFRGCENAADVQLDVLSDMGHEWPERPDDLSAAKRWADLLSMTTTALAFCETHAH